MKIRPICFFSFLLLIFFSSQTVFSQNNSSANYFFYNVAATKNKAREETATGARIAGNRLEIARSGGENSAVAVETLERRVFDLINERRADAGLPPLVWDKEAASAARMHSANMAAQNFFSHTGADGKNVAARAASVGLTQWRSIGENIATNRGFKSPLESAVQSWMNSPGHRDNILKGAWQQSGIGIAIKADGTYFFTQVFVLK